MSSLNALDEHIRPALSHRFLAFFLLKPELTAPVPIPSPVDVFFQRISGMERQLQTTQLREGGANVGVRHLPERVTHGNLVLERGVMSITPLTLSLDYVLSNFSMLYMDVMIMVMDDRALPVSTWIVKDALPARWQMGELDANSNKVLINHLEFSYSEILHIGKKL